MVNRKFIKCPVCSTTLRRARSKSTIVDVCPKCRGIWFDSGQFQQVVKALRKDEQESQKASELPARDEAQSQAGLREGQRICPSCGEKLKRFNYSCDSNVFLDKCPGCSGIWADRGEVKKVLDYLRKSEPDNFDARVLSEALAPPEKPRNLFVPSYDELSMFLMSATFLLLYVTNNTMRHQLHGFIRKDFDARSVILVIFFVVGAVLSLYHVFTKRQKSKVEKGVMLFFVVLVSAAAGICAGVHMLKTSGGWLIIFPLWNIISSILLLVMFRFGVVNTSCVADRDATVPQVAIGSIALIIVFAVCQYFFQLYWAITFSICVVYTTTLNKTLQDLFSPADIH